MQTSQDQIAHLLWCILVAVRTAAENHNIKSETGKRRFIAEWLRGARRHEPFKKMANEFQTIRQLLERDTASPIEEVLNALWMNAVSSAGCDLFRFRAVLHALNRHGWNHSLCPWPEQVVSEMLERQNGRGNHILQLTRMEEAFSPVGVMTAPITFQLIIKKNGRDHVEEAFHTDNFAVVRSAREISLHRATIRTLYIGHHKLPPAVWGVRDNGMTADTWHPDTHS